MLVLDASIVAESLRTLRSLGVHRNTIMYLAVKRAATIQGNDQNIKVDFKDFFERYMIVGESPSDKPYIIPFENSDAKLWMNRNLAGSFAPSSIRPDNPINTVLTVNGGGTKTTYSLRNKHWEQAKVVLLNNIRLPVFALAAFIYRDYAFQTDKMSAEMLINHYRSEFGYGKNSLFNEPEFEMLYDLDSVENSSSIFVPHSRF